MNQRLWAIVEVILALTVSAQAIQVLENSSTSAKMAWGGWNYFPNTGDRYGEAALSLMFTRALARPTYLNVIHQYSQSSGGCAVKVYLATDRQCNINPNADPRFHVAWWNASSATLGYYVGQYHSTYTKGLASFNVDSFVAANPAEPYYVLFDQQDDFADDCIDCAWLGPEGQITDIAEPTESVRASGNAVCRPNPATGPVEFRYSVSRPGPITVRVLDIAGRTVRVLNSVQADAGPGTATWDGLDAGGRRVAAGTYSIEARTVSSKSVGRVVLN